jgi:hypothetical protein
MMVRFMKIAVRTAKPTQFAQLAVLSLLLIGACHPVNADAQDCAGKLPSADRQRCEDSFTQRIRGTSRTSPLPGGWTLVRTPDPLGGPEAVSVLHAADMTKSDLKLAGLTFRCGRMGIEALLILLEPLTRGSRYDVSVKSGTTETRLEGKAIEGGEVLLLPPSAVSLASGAWQTVADLSVDIGGPAPIRGSVPVGGLSGALLALAQSCPAR